MSSNNRSASHITVDLSRRISLRALAILCSTNRRKQKVERVLVHVAKDCDEWQSMEDIAQTMLVVFAMLGSLPNLRSLILDLRHRTLPVESLAILLDGAHRLEELTLRQVTIPGELTQVLLRKVLPAHTRLESLTFWHCHACEAVQAFVTQLPSLRDLAIVGTRIGYASGQESQNPATVLMSACQQQKQLRRLHLEDVPDLCDEHISSLASALTSTSTCNLDELLLLSVSLGDEAGKAMANLMQTTNTLERVTLEMGYWSKCGSDMAQVLQRNTSIRQLQLLLTGRSQHSVEQKAQDVLAALSGYHSNVTHLTLCLHDTSIKPITRNGNTTVDSGLPSESEPSVINVNDRVWKALDQALETNHKLGQVVLMDASLQAMDIPASAQARLDRNKAGLSRLLYTDDKEEKDEGSFHEKYMRAIIDHKNNLDLVYFAISNYPSILSACCDRDDVNHDTSRNKTVSESISRDERKPRKIRTRTLPSPTSSFLASYKSKSRSLPISPTFIQRVRRLRGRRNQKQSSSMVSSRTAGSIRAL